MQQQQRRESCSLVTTLRSSGDPGSVWADVQWILSRFLATGAHSRRLRRAMLTMNHEESASAPNDTLEMDRPDGLPSEWILEIGGQSLTLFHYLNRGEEVVLGSASTADLRVEDPAVSRRHCRVVSTDTGIHIYDLGSRNGLYVGGVRVASACLGAVAAAFVVGQTTVALRPRAFNEVPGEQCLPGVVGSSSVMRRVIQVARRHAPRRVPILLQGESGTGKDVLARAIHEHSGRRGRYVPINAGALSDTMADSELFGHARGAFTGAVSARVGAFEQAHRGTLFLDEVGDISHTLQVKLLRVVEDGRVRPLGGQASTLVDARIVSATWVPLRERVEHKAFREDLYHRLSIVTIVVPPLRQRRSDIAQLSKALLSRMHSEVGEKSLSTAALGCLVSYDWPGNVRELNSVLYRAATIASGREIGPEHVRAACPDAPHNGKARRRTISRTDAFELLEQYDGNISAAARCAGVPRSTFRGWLRKT